MTHSYQAFKPEQLDEASRAHLLEIKTLLDGIDDLQGDDESTTLNVNEFSEVGRDGAAYSVRLVAPDTYMASDGDPEAGVAGSLLIFDRDSLQIDAAEILLIGRRGGSREVAIKDKQLPGFLGQVATGLVTEPGQ
jgi:hypothetical protein